MYVTVYNNKENILYKQITCQAQSIKISPVYVGIGNIYFA